ncbi:uncharacterized protein LOC135831541 [Planococcus citri]|uniref:uncharacterized protein LOC135831541 n=1 Tax=Planococcus citri TaxID=170843 RepID=UPI0031F88D05
MVLKNPQNYECWVKFCAKNVSQEGKTTFIAVMIKAFKKYFQQVFFDEASNFQVEEGKKGFCRLFSLLMNRISFRNTAACILLNNIMETLLIHRKIDFLKEIYDHSSGKIAKLKCELFARAGSLLKNGQLKDENRKMLIKVIIDFNKRVERVGYEIYSELAYETRLARIKRKH